MINTNTANRFTLIKDKMNSFSSKLTNDGIVGRERTLAYRQFCKDIREGDYLIKVSRKNKRNYCGEDNLYVDYTYTGDGWFVLSARKNAQWFTSKEAADFVKRNKGFSIIKK